VLKRAYFMTAIDGVFLMDDCVVNKRETRFSCQACLRFTGVSLWGGYNTPVTTMNNRRRKQVRK